jgi:hypothetical protein
MSWRPSIVYILIITYGCEGMQNVTKTSIKMSFKAKIENISFLTRMLYKSYNSQHYNS